MFGISLLLLGVIAFLAVTTAALVLVFTRGDGKGSCGCCAGCGLIAAMFLALVIGAGVVFLVLRHEHRGHQVRIRHFDSDQAAERFERSMEDLERKLDRMFDD